MNLHQTQGQPPGPHNGGGSSGSGGSSANRAAWQVEADLPVRREILAHILTLLRKTSHAPEVRPRLPEMVKRLEEALYRNASSQAEYADLSTLHQRIQVVAQQFRATRDNSRNAGTSVHPVATMIPTPGLPTSSRRDTVGGPSTGGQQIRMMPNGSAAAVARNSAANSAGVRMVQNAQQLSNPAAMRYVQQNGKLQQNGGLYHVDAGGKVDGKYVNGRVESPFIGAGQYSLNSNGMHPSSSYFGQGQIQRERFQIQKPENQSSKMIPVPGLPSQMQQQLQHEAKEPEQKQDGSSASSTTSTAPTPASGMSEQKKLVYQMLRHSTQCSAPEGQCPYVAACHNLRRVMDHGSKCRSIECQHNNCKMAKLLLRHQSDCSNKHCSICHGELQIRRTFNAGASEASGKRTRDEVDDQKAVSTEVSAAKRVKLEPGVSARAACSSSSGKGKAVQVEVQPAVPDCKQIVKREAGVSETQSAASCTVKPETGDSSGNGAKAAVELAGISFLEMFSKEQIKDHIASLRLWVGQTKAKAEKQKHQQHQVLEQQASDTICNLCGVEKLWFAPAPLYCTTCGLRIKRNMFYYEGTCETKYCYCCQCYNLMDKLVMEGQVYDKSKLVKKKNNEEEEEAWVLCDDCGKWQHQVCALFNGKRNETGTKPNYLCAHCLVKDKPDRLPSPPISNSSAKDLPRTALSDHLEQRLVIKLRQERIDRARASGKTFDEVPGADGLVVRVVSSTDKKLEVKQRFLEIFKDSNYPKEYLYKSKTLLLFQKIEGVEVCLFGMYVQEFGAGCPQQNNRRLYIAYLDSVKYFRPEVKTVNGEALRTFVYHELLIGYLEYSKARGFGSCYIWACPPLHGEDYILYCHPDNQKTPKSDILREWYLVMLAKATKENIVVELTNFYDYFFLSPDECKAHVTAARLPYFDGDYWPGAAEDMLLQLQQEEEERRKLPKKAIGKKGVAKRAGVQTEMVSNASKDLQLMHKLGQAILPMKDDFIMVHMHHSCRHCRLFITSGLRWVCKQCKSFQLCNRCYVADQKLDEKDRHPWNNREFHEFYSVEVADIPADTEDKDELMDCEIFDTRQAFLSMCQGNHYQYDTLRRAKHSSMMVLFHLHNPAEPAFVLSCNKCNNVIPTGEGFKCFVCADFDICNVCSSKEPKHPHPLTPQSELGTLGRAEPKKQTRQQRAAQLRKVMELLLHSAQCCAATCGYPKCRTVKNLFRHGTICKVRMSGGCAYCKFMWHILDVHARACQESDCRVPRCRDLKEYLRRQQAQSESRRRAAIKERVRQRTSGAENV